MKRELPEFLRAHPLFQKLGLSTEAQQELIRAIEEDYLAAFFASLIKETEAIMGIDPNLPEQQILEMAARTIVTSLDAQAASIRLFNPATLKMTSFGSYRFAEDERMSDIPFHDSIAGRVVQEGTSIPVPSILKDPAYKNKAIVRKKGFRSMLAVPLRIPRFMKLEEDLMGSLQIYFPEENRKFDALFVTHAELLARRVSYVLAKKRILDLQKLNARKENIVNTIFVKLSNREGVKLKDLFMALIPELGESLKVYGCSLFTVSRDQQFVRLEAAYPMEQSYHKVGSTYTVKRYPYFQKLIHGTETVGDTPYERMDRGYLLIKNPLRSHLISRGIREFAATHRIHSILIVPLRANDVLRHLMMFYATEQRQSFTDEEIELITFFGREVMKALRLELLDDVLHDFKNPAIAIAGFANRARKLLDGEDLAEARERLSAYLDIIVQETDRLKDLTISMSVEGREEIVDLSRVAAQRYAVNEEAIRALQRKNLEVRPPELEPDLLIFCSPFGMERVLDNVLSNATTAIPEAGGVLTLRTFTRKTLACLEVRNTGTIPDEKIEQVRRGDVKGRGLNIIHRFVQSNHGRFRICNESGETVCTIEIPQHRTIQE